MKLASESPPNYKYCSRSSSLKNWQGPWSQIKLNFSAWGNWKNSYAKKIHEGHKMKKQTTTTIFTFLGKNFKSSVMTEIFAYMAVYCRKTSLIFRERCCSCLKQEVIIEKMIYLFFERMCLCRFAKKSYTSFKK